MCLPHRSICFYMWCGAALNGARTWFCLLVACVFFFFCVTLRLGTPIDLPPVRLYVSMCAPVRCDVCFLSRRLSCVCVFFVFYRFLFVFRRTVFWSNLLFLSDFLVLGVLQSRMMHSGTLPPVRGFLLFCVVRFQNPFCKLFVEPCRRPVKRSMRYKVLVCCVAVGRQRLTSTRLISHAADRSLKQR